MYTTDSKNRLIRPIRSQLPAHRRRQCRRLLMLRSHGRRFSNWHRARVSKRRESLWLSSKWLMISSYRIEMISHQLLRRFKLSQQWMSKLVMALLCRLRLSRSQKMLISFKSSLPWRRLWRRQLRKLIDRDWLWLVRMVRHSPRALSQSKAKPCKNWRENKKHSNRHFWDSLTWRKSKGRLRSNKTKSLKTRSLWPKKKDNKRKFFLIQELVNWRDFKKKRLPRNWRLKEWNKNSLQLKLFRRQRPPLQRKQLQKQTLLDWRESTSSQEERPKLNSRCLKSNNKWKLSKLLNSKNKDFLKIKQTLRNKSSFLKLNKRKQLPWLNKKLPLKLRKKPLRRKHLKRNKLPSKKLLQRKLKLRNWRSKSWRRRRLRNRKQLKKRKRKLRCSSSPKSKNLRLRKPKRRRDLNNSMKKLTRNLINSALPWTKSTLMPPFKLKKKPSKPELKISRLRSTPVTSTRSHSPSLKLPTTTSLLSNSKPSLLLSQTWTTIHQMSPCTRTSSQPQMTLPWTSKSDIKTSGLTPRMTGAHQRRKKLNEEAASTILDRPWIEMDKWITLILKGKDRINNLERR